MYFLVFSYLLSYQLLLFQVYDVHREAQIIQSACHHFMKTIETYLFSLDNDVMKNVETLTHANFAISFNPLSPNIKNADFPLILFFINFLSN